MGIASLKFLLFIIITLIAYYVVPGKLQWIVLLIASSIFYLTYSVGGLFILISTALIIWFLALQIQKSKDKEKSWISENRNIVDKETRKTKKDEFHRHQFHYELLAIIITVGILFLTKYYGPLATGINLSLGTQLWTAENILLPLGISYYSLQLMGYIIDVSRDIIPAEKNPLKVILYGMFFLSIMQGPFNRYNDLMPQICKDDRPKLNFTQFKFAVLRILGGYIKKLCIADQVGIIANEVFTNYAQYSGLGILFGIFCFAIQLYADFSGYMDIIIGVGELFGIRMPENFSQPFFARNISEFWRRWHITLGLWLKDYVFYPILKSKTFLSLGKKVTARFGKEVGRRIPTYIGMLLLWALIGTWHGAGFNYVFSVGILQFLYIFIGEVAEPLFVKMKTLFRINGDGLSWHIFQSIRTTVLMMLAWTFFKSKTIIEALGLIKNILEPKLFDLNSLMEIFFNTNSTMYIGKHGYIWIGYVAICTFVLLVLDLIKENGMYIRTKLQSRCAFIQASVFLLMLLTILVFGAYGSQYVASNFIYFEF